MTRTLPRRLLAAVCLLLTTLYVLPVAAQSNEKKKAALERQIAQSKKLLQAAERDVRSQMQSLAVMEGLIGKQQTLTRSIQTEIDSLEKRTTAIEDTLQVLGSQLALCQERYATTLRQTKSRNTFENRMMFLFSAESFNAMPRRARYLQQYAHHQENLAADIRQHQSELAARWAELERTKAEKTALKAEQEAQLSDLNSQRQKLADRKRELEKHRKEVNAELQRQEKELMAVKKAIEREIAEIARKKAEAAKKKESKTNAATKGNAKTNAATPSGKHTTATATPKGGTFAGNAGRLPVPLSGIVTAATTSSLTIASPVDEDATVKTVFSGIVEAISTRDNGTSMVLVSHDDDAYYTVYSNIVPAASVSIGKHLPGGAVLGTAGIEDGQQKMTFFIYKRTGTTSTSLDPRQWVKY